jgi:hypothetical protein
MARQLNCEGPAPECYSGPLEWYQQDGVRVSRIKHEVRVDGYRDDEVKWPEMQDAIVDAMVRL